MMSDHNQNELKPNELAELKAACERRAEELGMSTEDLIDRMTLDLMAEHGIPKWNKRAEITVSEGKEQVSGEKEANRESVNLSGQMELNEKVARLRGWTFHPTPIGGVTTGNWQRPDGSWTTKCPDYCNDLNACHKAEKVLLTTPDKRISYLIKLLDTGDDIAFASAHRRATALVATMARDDVDRRDSSGAKERDRAQIAEHLEKGFLKP